MRLPRLPRYCKAVLLTSLLWLIVFLLFLYSDNFFFRSLRQIFIPHHRLDDSIIRKRNIIIGDDDDENDNQNRNVGRLPNDFLPNVDIDDIKIQISDDQNHVVGKRGELKNNNNNNKKAWPGINQDLSLPGEMGKAVKFTSKSDQDKAQEMFKINQFNVYASQQISLDRSLKDVRNSACKNRANTYDLQRLPNTSVIIVFHNEAWSTLLRTIHSVINRSPRHLIHEIILVDDKSEKDHLGQKLEDELSGYPVTIKIIRQPERKGLIRARLTGAEAATGDTLTFLDAHCECSPGWLEPLLDRIHNDRTTVVCPIIDVISDDTFEYLLGSEQTWGGFNWKLNFRWYPVPERENIRRGHDKSVPLRSPTMAGGLFTIEREYFYQIGSYDSGMDIWGGENLEMSFRIWQCGGNLEIHPCSHVGHVFRKQTPYTFPGGTGTIINRNNRRLAEVWMDDYIKFYYMINPHVLRTDAGDLTERRNLRRNLQCKSFSWYLDNIYPEAHIPRSYKSFGEIKTPSNDFCLDTLGHKENENIGAFKCHNQGGNQVFCFTEDGEIRTDDLCLDAAGANNPIKLIKCHKQKGNQLWLYDSKLTGQIKHYNTGLCLQISPKSSRDRNMELKLGQCSNNLPSDDMFQFQHFTLTNRTVQGWSPKGENHFDSKVRGL